MGELGRRPGQLNTLTGNRPESDAAERDPCEEPNTRPSPPEPGLSGPLSSWQHLGHDGSGPGAEANGGSGGWRPNRERSWATREVNWRGGRQSPKVLQLQRLGLEVLLETELAQLSTMA